MQHAYQGLAFSRPSVSVYKTVLNVSVLFFQAELQSLGRKDSFTLGCVA